MTMNNNISNIYSKTIIYIHKLKYLNFLWFAVEWFDNRGLQTF